MQVGELFVSLGVKGSDKTLQAFTQVKTGLSGVASMSLETKAAIIGAMYALERLMSTSGAMGTSLMNFTALTGESAIALQKWEFAARQIGATNQEMESSFKGVQNAMTQMLLTGKTPESWGFFASSVGLDVNRVRDTEYVLQKMQEFARKVQPEVASTVLRGFGLSDNIIAGMRRNAFRPDVFSRAPSYSQSEISALDKANIAWSNLGTKIEMAVGHFNAMHGGQLVKDISNITDQVLKLANALVTLAEKLKVFSIVGKAFEGWSMIFGLLNNAIEGKDLGKGILPNVRPNSSSNNTNQNINIANHFQHDGKDHQRITDSVHKGVKNAFRQMPAQRGGF